MREVHYLLFLFERISAVFHLFLFDGSIGKVCSFYQHDDCIYVGVGVHKAISHAKLLFENDVHEVQFIDARSIVEPVFWYAKATGILAVFLNAIHDHAKRVEKNIQTHTYIYKYADCF